MSPKLQQTVQATIEPEVTLEPEVLERVSPLLRTFLDLKQQVDLLTEQMDEEKRKIKGEMELAGVQKTRVDGTPVTIVRSSQRKLDKLKFVELGGSLEMLENATFDRPKKPYIRIGEDKEGSGD